MKDFPNHAPVDKTLAAFSKLIVISTVFLIFVGGHTTTSGAGMAFADWPLSAGSLNPEGWWGDLLQRLEHGHRLTAETVGLLVGILCAWVWRSKWAVPASALGSILVAGTARLMGYSGPAIAHLGLWSSVIIFLAVLGLSRSRGGQLPSLCRWLSVAAFLGVCVQALMGGFRVTLESGGDVRSATLLRVIHGCFAQFELCLLVAIATLLSPRWRLRQWKQSWVGIGKWGWFAAACVYMQLCVGATMRHLGAGLAIPTFPAASASGEWLPSVASPLVHLNFTHTRVGALVVSIALLIVGWKAFKAGVPEGLRMPLGAMALMLVVQWGLGIAVIWHHRPLLPTTAHVVNGALLLAGTVWMSLTATLKPVGPRGGAGVISKAEGVM